MSRTLAHIETVKDIEPIEGADNIELITILGWKCIAKKEEFKVGDKALYIEIDSKCPSTDERFAFLEKKNYNVRTMKLNKFHVISQGLALPLDEFPEFKDLDEGSDVTDKLGIIYSVPEDNERKADYNSEKDFVQKHKSKFTQWLMKYKYSRRFLLWLFYRSKESGQMPEFVHKTDEVRCLNGDAKIITNNGIQRISYIVNHKLNVKVLSYNFNTKVFEYKDILDYQRFDREPTIKITYSKNLGYDKSLTSRNSNSVICSYDHMILTNNGYKKAIDIDYNDKIMCIHKNVYTDDDMSLIYGMLIGDSHLTIDHRYRGQYVGTRIEFTQGEKQLDYLKEKLRLLNASNCIIHKGKSGYCNNSVYSAHTKQDWNLAYNLYKDNAIMQNGKLYKSKEFCDRLTPISLAFWYLDDGSLSRKSDGNSDSIKFSTYSETKEEVENLLSALNKYGVNAQINETYKHGKFLGYVIVLNKEPTHKFLRLIQNYIPYCMRYKTLSEYKDAPYILEDKQIVLTDKLLPSMVISTIKYRAQPLYDITVADNHNFVSCDCISHNCEQIPDIVNNHDYWISTEKLDGTSVSLSLQKIGFGKYDFAVCSRNRRIPRNKANENDNYIKIAEKYDIEAKLKDMLRTVGGKKIVLQGKMIGPGIQKNPYKLSEREFHAFNLYLENFDGSMSRVGTVEMANILKGYRIPTVPILDTDHELPHTMEEMKAEATGKSVINPSVMREGIVYRSPDGRKSFKNVSNEYLLRHNG